MDKNKNRPSAATPGRLMETVTFDRATQFQTNHNTQGKRLQGKIESLLSHGAENAVPLRHLCKITGSPARQVRRMIQAERLQGVPILADNQNGYFLPKSSKEIDEFVKSMFHRAYEISKVANAVRLRGRLLE